MPPRKDYGEPSRRSERLGTTTIEISTRNSIEDNVSTRGLAQETIYIQDYNLESDGYYDTDLDKQLVTEMASEENNDNSLPATKLELLR